MTVCLLNIKQASKAEGCRKDKKDKGDKEDKGERRDRADQAAKANSNCCKTLSH